MKRIILLLIPTALVLSGCLPEDDWQWYEDPMQGFDTPVSNLKDPALSWSADSFEATLGGTNTFPTLNNSNGVSVTYSSSVPEVATIDSKGSISLLAAGTTMISATSVADNTYSSSKYDI